MEVNFYILFFGISLLSFSIANSSNTEVKCTTKENCSECIRILNCAWCSEENFLNKSRCNEIGSEVYHSCSENFKINPKSKSLILKSDELTRTKLKKNIILKENEKNVQIKPQHLSLKLRPNEVYELKFQYSQAEDYPLDLYYLMDLSNSMKDHKEKLSALGEELATQMRKITKNFKLGFGSFVDKVKMPFTDVSEIKLQNPCKGSLTGQCTSPYSYKHHMSLTNNSKLFALEVKSSKVSGNLDRPEGGFDALMQSMICQKHIGWREDARHLIVFSTDASFHYAGDGKLAGLIEPNDGKCHMENNQYTHAEILDYPSVSHLNHIAKENSINMIFAVTENVESIYKNLATKIQGASAAVIDKQSSNIIEILKYHYNQITSSIEIKDNAKSPINIRYFTTCLDQNSINVERNKCNKLKDDSLIEFTAKISFSECPRKKSDWNQTFELKPIGINEDIKIDLQMICDCNCENSIQNSKKCNEHGTYECGICNCNDEYHGRKCECSRDFDFSQISSKNCKQNESDLIECNGRGTCLCGICECNIGQNSEKIYSGNFCECDNLSCPSIKGKMCAGKDHGICECGKCICKIGWEGPNCDCETSKQKCYKSFDKNVCSGNGNCICGKCRCENDFYGKYCESCPSCPNRCEELKYCIECQIHGINLFNEKDECLKNCTFNSTIIDNIKIIQEDSDYEKRWQLCKQKDENNCEFIFEYREDDKLEVRAEKEKKCQQKISAIKTVLYVVLAILILGILILLLWKVIAMIQDKREFAKFEKEKMKLAWNKNDNPLYKEANTSYKNPAFAY